MLRPSEKPIQKAEREAQISRMVAELVGTNPAPKAAVAFAADLATFDRQLWDYIKVHRNTERGLIDTNGSTTDIPNLAPTQKPKRQMNWLAWRLLRGAECLPKDTCTNLAAVPIAGLPVRMISSRGAI